MQPVVLGSVGYLVGPHPHLQGILNAHFMTASKIFGVSKQRLAQFILTGKGRETLRLNKWFCKFSSKRCLLLF